MGNYQRRWHEIYLSSKRIMNTTILQKCLDELSKESPKLDYIRGMIETLLAITESPKTVHITKPEPQHMHHVPTNIIEGVPTLSASMIDRVKKSAAESLES